MRNENIICVTMSDWDEPKRCRHHLMSVLSKDNRVLFVERPVNLLSLLRNCNEWKRLLKIFKGIRKQDNLFLLAPLPNLPGGDWVPWVNAVNQKIIELSVKAAARKLGMGSPVLWIFAFTGGGLVGKFSEKFSIYFCNDPFGMFAPPGRKRKGIHEIERRLIEKVNWVFAVSNDLVKEKARLNRRSYLIPHGVRAEMIDRQVHRLPLPLKDIGSPRIGYVGAIHDKLDYDLIAAVARQRRDWNILMIGPIAEISPDKLARVRDLQKMQNVCFSGNISQDALRDYLGALDVCLLPYARDDFSATFWVPLKFYEYLAAGKPIVSSIGLQGALGYDAAVVRFADDTAGFIQCIEQGLNDHDQATAQKRMDIARQNTWEKRAEEISRLIAGRTS